MPVPSVAASGIESRSILPEVEALPLAALVVATTPGDRGGVLAANDAARRLSARADALAASVCDLIDDPAGRLKRALDDPRPSAVAGLSAVGAPADRMPLSVHVGPELGGHRVVQIVEGPVSRTSGAEVAEERRFRSALLELSALASSTEDDDFFYQRLIERAVEVVPGAQAGSVMVNVPDTTRFRFVSAVGFSLEGLQRHELDHAVFFRDAIDPNARIVRSFDVVGRSPEITEWLETEGRLSEIVVNVSAPVMSGSYPVAFLSLDNFEDPDAFNETSVEMTTVLSSLLGELLRRRRLESEIRTEREAYRHLALHDPLTELANRRHLESLLRSALETRRRGATPSAVLFVDIDDFKGVNDRLGHESGDQLLAGVARGLRQAVRSGDVVGRWGGDEFLVILADVGDADQAERLAERVLQQFTEPLDLADGLAHRARLTVGVGWSNDSAVDLDGLVRAADLALYEAKAAGKGVVRVRKA